jgi:hypothetical protein
MKKLITPLLVFAALVGGFLSARQLDAQVIWSPRQGVHFTGTVDPTAGVGLVAAEGTIYVRIGATDGLYVKTGSANTAWTSIAMSGSAGSFSSLTVTGRTTSAGFTSSIDGDTTTAAFAFLGDENTGVFSGADGRVSTVGNGTEGLRTSSFAVQVTNAVQGNLVLTTGYLQLPEIAAPGTGGADTVRLYGVVDGGSKTDFAAIFQSGAAQTVAQEP